MYWKGNYYCKGDVSAMYKKQLEILSEAKFEVLANGTVIDKQIKYQLKGLEYLIYIAQIFNQYFINKEINMTNENINKLELQMKEYLQYFVVLRTVAIARKLFNKEWEIECVSAQTFNNLWIQVAGFFQFTRYILKADVSITYALFLYSNQLLLESHFS